MKQWLVELLISVVIVSLVFMTGAMISMTLCLLSLQDTAIMAEVQLNRIANSYDKLLGVQQHGNNQVPDRMLRDLPLEQREQAQGSVPVD